MGIVYCRNMVDEFDSIPRVSSIEYKRTVGINRSTGSNGFTQTGVDDG